LESSLLYVSGGSEHRPQKIRVDDWRGDMSVENQWKPKAVKRAIIQQ
jgi:hypothetical protein